MDGVEILEAQGGYVFGAFKNVFVTVWRQTTTKIAAARLSNAIERFAARRKEGVAMIVVIEATCDMPDGDVRETMARDMKRHDPFTKQMLLVLEGTGFRVAAMRSVVIGLQMLSRQSVPTKTVAAVADGARWLEAQSGLPAAEVEAAVAFIRKAKTPGTRD